MDFTLNNKGLTTAKVIYKQFSDTKIEDLAIMIDRYKEADAWLTNPFVEEKFYNSLVKLLQDNNLIKDKVYYKDLVNNLYE